MKKNIARIFICFSMIYTTAALEVSVPKFNFGVLAANQSLANARKPIEPRLAP